MSRVFFISKRNFIWTLGAIMIIAAFIIMINQTDGPGVLPANAPTTKERTIHMLTVEYKGKTADGKEIEIYRFEPGNIILKKGEQVKLSLYGVNGKSHPFVIEGTNIQGEVRQGEETIVSFKAEKTGVYRIICWTHANYGHHGPMIGYIYVID